MATSSKPVFVVAPGASCTPALYGYMMHLLMEAGYGAVSSILPSTAAINRAKVTVQDDVEYIRDCLILPVIDKEERDVILLGHSYSAIPGSAAVAGLGKSTRSCAGKKAAVIGQMYIASAITKGGDGKSIVEAFGGDLLPHTNLDEAAHVLRCDDMPKYLMKDVNSTLASAAAASTLCPSITAFLSPVPHASWDEEDFSGRIAYIKTLEDEIIPEQMQDLVIKESGVSWITKEIQTAHCPMLSKPKELVKIILEIAQEFEELDV